MTRLPRDISGPDLVRALSRLGYTVSRQTGSHFRLTTTLHGEHHITIPAHTSLRIGTIAAVLADIAAHHGLTRDALIERLFS